MVHDLTMDTYSAYDLAKVIEKGNYTNIFYYEFHIEVNPEGIHNCLIGLETFSENSKEFYNIFVNGQWVDEFPAVISFVIGISGNWYIAEAIGFNYYLGVGPRGILKLREACAKKGVLGMAFTSSFGDWVKTNLNGDGVIEGDRNFDQIQFERIIEALRLLSRDMQRRPRTYQGLHEPDIRDKILVPLNVIFRGRANAESMNVKGKTDILIRTEDGLNEHIFELKVWHGIKELTDAINQLKRYLSWHNNYAGLILFSYQKNFTLILEKITTFLNEDFELKSTKGAHTNEFHFSIKHPSDEDKIIELILIVINLRIN